MLRTPKTRMAACSLLLALPLALSACGGSDDSPKTGGSGSAAAAPSSTAPASTPSMGSTDSTPSASSTATGGGVGKPTKAEVAAGFKSTYDDDPAMSKTIDTQKFSTCMADKSYDTMTAKSLNAIKDDKPEEMDAQDLPKLIQYGGPCARDSAKPGATMPSMPSGFPTTMPSMPSMPSMPAIPS